MILTRDEIMEKWLYAAVDEIQETMDGAGQFEKSPATKLFGEGAELDSMDLVNFIIAVEGHIADATGKSIRLVSDRALSRRSSPFRTLETLAVYIEELLTEPAH